jgi:hypothetical protein
MIDTSVSFFFWTIRISLFRALCASLSRKFDEFLRRLPGGKLRLDH